MGGSSIGLYELKKTGEASLTDQAIAALKDAKTKGLVVGDNFIVEPFVEGPEFTITVLQDENGNPVALIPTELQIVKGGSIFDYRKKYLPTDSTILHCPPRFTEEQIDKIRMESERIFSLFGFKDLTRIDGRILPDGTIVYTDINTVPDMEQNSFVFQQAATIGLRHAELLWHITSTAAKRFGIAMVECMAPKAEQHKKRVNILMGGNTAERQVSLMSGTNVWLKLLKSNKYDAKTYLVDGSDVWELPYAYALSQTVEEIRLNCEKAQEINASVVPLAEKILAKLGMPYNPEIEALPRKMTYDDFCELSAQQDAFVWIGLHGGDGEGGPWQERLEKHGIPFNGSDSEASRICMDKAMTGELINQLNDSKIFSLPKEKFNLQTATDEELKIFWEKGQQARDRFGADSFAIKPLADGCSSGIVRLYAFDEFKAYAQLVRADAPVIPACTFKNQDNEVAMPQDKNPEYILEPFIQVDYIRVVKNEIKYEKHKGWLEYTVGVREQGGKYHALNPSITIAEGEVLSLEEKFQGGTGVNLTPPPDDILSPLDRKRIQKAIEKVAGQLGIKNYARIDIHYNTETKELSVIEANSLPGMTPSNVIYHQALVDHPPQEPLGFIEGIIGDAIKDSAKPMPANRNALVAKTRSGPVAGPSGRS